MTMAIPKPGVKSLVHRESGYDICVLQVRTVEIDTQIDESVWPHEILGLTLSGNI